MFNARRLAVIATILLGLCGVAATAYAAAPRVSPPINGCVNKQTGVLRVVDPAKGCITRPGPFSESPIQWNQAGPAGPVGPAGPTQTGNGAAIERRTVTQTLTTNDLTPIVASCNPQETVVTGSWTANGQSPYGNPAVSYSLGDTGERNNGYQVTAGRGYQDNGTEPLIISVTAVCLIVS